jgi:hypothetical protein
MRPPQRTAEELSAWIMCRIREHQLSIGDPVKCGARVALGGYFLGRTNKMELALMLSGMAAGRQAGGPGQILAQGR